MVSKSYINKEHTLICTKVADQLGIDVALVKKCVKMQNIYARKRLLDKQSISLPRLFTILNYLNIPERIYNQFGKKRKELVEKKKAAFTAQIAKRKI